MVEDVLVKERTLSAEEIALGEKFLDRLDSADFPVSAAYWISTSESEFWRLQIVTPQVDRVGQFKVYERFHELGLNLIDLNVQAIGPRYRFFGEMLKAIRTRKPLSKARLSMVVVDSDLAELYIYRFPQTINGSDKGSKHA